MHQSIRDIVSRSHWVIVASDARCPSSGCLLLILRLIRVRHEIACIIGEASWCLLCAPCFALAVLVGVHGLGEGGGSSGECSSDICGEVCFVETEVEVEAAAGVVGGSLLRWKLLLLLLDARITGGLGVHRSGCGSGCVECRSM